VQAYALALAALGDPTRRAIFERLRSGPLPVGRLADGLPVSRPAVSQHLRVLKDACLVSERREGTRRIYGVEPAGIRELKLYLDGFWDDVLAAFKARADGGRESPRGRERERKRSR
jgi:DNA-binding transcriptional ArsR family regulator